MALNTKTQTQHQKCTALDFQIKPSSHVEKGTCNALNN
jgi:uncharacterized protein YcbK (DUF882 family)